GEGGGVHVVEGLRLRCHVSRLDGDVLGEGPVAVAVDQPVHLVADAGAGGAPPEGGDDAGEFVTRGTWAPVGAGPGRPQRPLQLSRGEAARVHLREDVADGWYGLGSIFVHEAVDALEALQLVDSDRLHRGLLRSRRSPC